ncbi:MAG: hypothetical protein ABI607_03885 [Betaproteobacteria bacterium]
MDCTICGKPTLLGAMLCAPCKAALKRARYVTVQEDMRRPSVIDVRRSARRVSAQVPSQTPTPGPESPLPVPIPTDAAANAQLARRIFGGIFILAAVLGSASYFGLRDLSARPQEVSTANATVVDAAPAAAVPVTAPAPMAAPPVAAPTTPQRPDAAEMPVNAEGVERKLPFTSSAATSTGRRTTSRNTASFATTSGDPPDAVPMPEPEKPQPLPAPPPPPVPDRWQNMHDAIAQCDREGVFSGIICGQKVRIQYCEGYWGKVDICPGPTVNPEH